MAKIMLVEDDNNLREIYEARLLAEGYEIVSAKDGEEALALAVKERPDLIISDVMMPKISGFDMLDILRSTPETKDTKVIMMTALSQAEDKTRADKLGADRYLVKSQVTLEDVAKVAREVLQGEDAPTPMSPSNDAVFAAAPQPSPAATPIADDPPSAAPTEPPATNPPTVQPPATNIQVNNNNPIPVQEPPTVDETKQATETAEKLTDAVNNLLDGDKGTEPTDTNDDDSNASSRKRIIQPINDLSGKPDLNALLEKENTGEQAPQPTVSSVITPDNPVVATPIPNKPLDTTTDPGSTQRDGDSPNSIAL